MVEIFLGLISAGTPILIISVEFFVKMNSDVGDHHYFVIAMSNKCSSFKSTNCGHSQTYRQTDQNFRGEGTLQNYCIITGTSRQI